MLELDCHLTKDKHVVVVHDSCLERLTGENLIVEECNYSQLPPLQTTLNIDFAPGMTCLQVTFQKPKQCLKLPRMYLFRI